MTGRFPINPWTGIWLHPRQTIQAIVDTDPARYVFPLAAVAGIAQALDRASLRDAGDYTPLPMILLGSLGGGVFAGLVSLFLFAWVLKWSGRWLGGNADAERLRAAIAWSAIPSLCALPLWIPELHYFGKDLFTSESPRIEQQWRLFLAFAFVEIALAAWRIVALIKCVAQVQGFSAWRALGNIALAALLIVLPIALLAFVARQLAG